jgi:hypothetical protein
MKTKRIDVRLPLDLYADLKKKDGSITENICAALRIYLKDEKHTKNNPELLDYFKDEILWLHNAYSKQLDAYLDLRDRYLEKVKKH